MNSTGETPEDGPRNSARISSIGFNKILGVLKIKCSGAVVDGQICM